MGTKGGSSPPRGNEPQGQGEGCGVATVSFEIERDELKALRVKLEEYREAACDVMTAAAREVDIARASLLVRALSKLSRGCTLADL